MNLRIEIINKLIIDYFGKSLNIFLSNKGSHIVKLRLAKGTKSLQDNSEIAVELINFLLFNIRYKLELLHNQFWLYKYLRPYWKRCKWVKIHLIILLTHKIVNQEKFSFKRIAKLDIEKEAKIANSKKTTINDTV